jgi:hypothetical protein
MPGTGGADLDSGLDGLVFMRTCTGNRKLLGLGVIRDDWRAFWSWSERKRRLRRRAQKCSCSCPHKMRLKTLVHRRNQASKKYGEIVCLNASVSLGSNAIWLRRVACHGRHVPQLVCYASVDDNRLGTLLKSRCSSSEATKVLSRNSRIATLASGCP